MQKLFIAFLLFFAVFIPSTVFAENEFSTTYDASFNVQNDGSTEVSEKITLKNLTSKYYASNFAITIGSTAVSGVSATDESGPMEVKVETQGNNTQIGLAFNQQVAGMGKTQIFTLKYKSDDFAENIGKVWEVNLPKIPDGGEIENYNLTLSVPVSFGDPTSIFPKPKSESQSFDRLFYKFEKNQLIASGVSVSFGSNQVFDFTLKYQINNDSLFPVISSIALPPDTNYQDTIISKISPEPINVTIDEDGNYLAWYRLNRKSGLNITVAGSAKIYLAPKSKKFFELTNTQRQELTKNDTYWEKDNPAISAALSEIFKEGTPDKTADKANLIYRYVVSRLKYDEGKLNGNLERLGAVTALNNPSSAVCMEFTDLFIALSRAAGIPARELDGFGYSRNSKLRPLSLSKDLLHAWPEYFDEDRGWIMVDPTWENTSGGVDYFNKFDLNHIFFAIKGFSSKELFIGSDTNVSVSNSDFLGKPQLEVLVELPNILWSPLPQNGTIKIINHGNSLQPPSDLSLNTEKINILGPTSIKLGAIPPFGSSSYPLNLRTPDFWRSFEGRVEVTAAGQKFIKKVEVKPLFSFVPLPYILGGIILASGSVYGGILALHIYQKRLRKPKIVQ